MTERVHPSDSPATAYSSGQFSGEFSGQFNSGEFPRTKPGTYVVQIPKDQIYRVPPPENAHRFQYLSRRKMRRNSCRGCFCSFLAALIVLAVFAGIAAGVLYLVYRPEAPRYSVEGVSIKAFNVTSSSPISPVFDVSMRAHNPNGKIGMYYERGSSVDLYYEGVHLCEGAWAEFHTPTENATDIETVLSGSGIQLTEGTRRRLRNQQKNGKVPFQLKVVAPVKFKVGSLKTWSLTVKINCGVTVDKLTTKSKVVSDGCDHAFDLW